VADHTGAFDWQFHVGKETQIPGKLEQEARKRMMDLAQGHSDLIGAAANIERPARRESAYIYEARIVAYVRPDNVVAVQKAVSAEAALDAALPAVERQVRSKRDILRKPWQQPHSDDTEYPLGG